MPRIAIISDRWPTLQWIWKKGEIFKKRARERAGHGKRWKQFAGNAERELEKERERSESKRGGGRERRRESGRRMSPVAVGAEEKRVTRCWVGLWDPQESRGAEMR